MRRLVLKRSRVLTEPKRPLVVGDDGVSACWKRLEPREELEKVRGRNLERKLGRVVVGGGGSVVAATGLVLLRRRVRALNLDLDRVLCGVSGSTWRRTLLLPLILVALMLSPLPLLLLPLPLLLTPLPEALLLLLLLARPSELKEY